jgi:ferredoxin
MSRKDLILVVDAEKCTGCKICELVCSFNITNEYNPRKSLIKIINNREFGVFIPVLKESDCKGCEKCVKACPTQALFFVEPKEAALMRGKNKIGVFPIPLIPR